MKKESNKKVNFREFILGGQDGIVNVLGLVLGVAGATLSSNIVIISGLVATVAESVSMAAVAYTSSKAAKDYYHSIKHKIHFAEFENPLKSAWTVGMATIIGSLIPLAPFFFFSVKNGIIISLILSGIVLFVVGALKAKLSIGSWKRSGLELMIIGLIAALVGYGVGLLLKGYGIN